MGDKYVERNMATMLEYRMGWNYEDPRCPFYKYVPVRIGDRAVVFVVWDDKYATVEDELAMYPSDALVTKLRLLVGPQN